MALIVLDTSVLTRLANSAVRDAITPLAVDGVAARVAISDLEIGFSARNGEEWDELHASLEALERLEVDDRSVRRALAVQRALADRGLRGRKVPDLLVAAAAEAAGAEVLHYDRDFDLIAEFTGQAASWVVPRGSVD